MRAAIAYVRRKEDDVDTIMPSLYAGRNGGKKKPVVDEPTKPTTPVVTQPTDNPASPVVAPVVTAAAHAAAETKVETPSPTKPVSPAVIENGPFMK